MHHPYPSNPHPPNIGRDYRGSGAVLDTALPLPRQGLLPWTLVLPFCGFISLFFPWAAILFGLKRPNEITMLLKEGGAPALLLVFLHIVLTIGVTILGVFAVRGKRIPSAAFVGAAMFPAFVTVLGALWAQKRMMSAIAYGVSPSLHARIGAQGHSEIDSLFVLGMLISGCLSTLGAIAVLGSVLTINGRKLEENASSPAKSPMWLIGAAIGGVLFLLAAILHLANDGPSIGMSTLLVLFAAAFAAGPLFRVMCGVVAATTNASALPSSNANDLRRVSGAVIVGAILVVLSVFFLERSSVAFAERGFLQLLGIANEVLESASHKTNVGALGAELRDASTNLLVDTIAAAFLFAPALLLAVRRPSWASVAVTGAVVVFFGITFGGWSLARRNSFKLIAARWQNRQDELPSLVPMGRHGASSRDDGVAFAIKATGEIREVDSVSPYASEEAALAPDKSAPFTALVEAATRLKTTSGSASSSYLSPSKVSSPTAIRARLVGKADPLVFPSSLEAYRAFQPASLRGYAVEIEPKRNGAALLDALSTSTWGRTQSTFPFYVYATSGDRAKITCSNLNEIVAREISVSDAEDAESSIMKLYAQCTVSQVIVVPLESASTEDVYRLLAALPTSTWSSASTTKPKLSADRAAATAWMEKNPPGARPAPEPVVGSSATGTATTNGFVRQGATSVNGRLPPEIVQRVVRQNMARFQRCYEDGLRYTPRLAGRVTVKFVIDRSGHVMTAQDGGSDLPDPVVVSCVVRSFSNLTFPAPDGGIVTVTYPLVFAPSN